GSEFDVSLLAASLEIGIDAALQRLEPAVDARLVTTGEGPAHYRFSHALVRDTLYEELGVSARALRHRRAAEAMELVHG
ncbi:hypothetical protein NVV43_31010, partial [Escherichia marmotae]|nr:hypothetical protein [Escherichia marmotae]